MRYLIITSDNRAYRCSKLTPEEHECIANGAIRVYNCRLGIEITPGGGLRALEEWEK
jgi:hypothetical protein